MFEPYGSVRAFVARLFGLITPEEYLGQTIVSEGLRIFNGDSKKAREVHEQVADWSTKYLLIALIPVESLRTPTVVRITSLQSVPGSTALANQKREPHQKASRRSVIAHTIRRVLGGSISWGTVIPINGVDRATSHHVNAHAPSGFFVNDAALRIERSGDYTAWICDDDRLPSAGHVFCPADTTPGKSRSAIFTDEHFAVKAGVLAESLVLSLVAAAIVGFMTMRMRHLGFDVRKLKDSSGQMASVILLLPGVLITFITYRESNRVAQHALTATRITLLLQALGLLGCVLPLALAMGPDAARRT